MFFTHADTRRHNLVLSSYRVGLNKHPLFIAPHLTQPQTTCGTRRITTRTDPSPGRTLPAFPQTQPSVLLVCDTLTSHIASLAVLTSADPHEPSSPPSSQSSPNQPPQFLSKPNNISDDEEGEDGEEPTRAEGQSLIPPKGGYDSRVQQLLYENPDLEIIITAAGKSSDGGYIVYRIRTGVGFLLPSGSSN